MKAKEGRVTGLDPALTCDYSEWVTREATTPAKLRDVSDPGRDVRPVRQPL